MKKKNIKQGNHIAVLVYFGITLILIGIFFQWQGFFLKSSYFKVLTSKTLGGLNNDYANHIIQIKGGGGFLVVGETLTNPTWENGKESHDAWIMKLDPKLNLLWQKTIGGSGENEVKKIFGTKDGNFSIIGSKQTPDKKNNNSYGDFDYWFLKTDPQGNILWQRCYGGSLEDRAFDAIQVNNGGYLLIGYTYSDNGDVTEKFIGKDVWLVRIDEDGKILWQRKLGGIDNEAYKIIQTSEGGFLMVGYTPGIKSVFDDNGASEHDALIVKLSRQGTIEWLKTMGGSDEDRATSVIETSKHEYLITGWTRSKDGNVKRNHGSSDYWVIKLTQHGNLRWSKTYGGSKSDMATSIVETIGNRYLIVGESRSKDGDLRNNHGGSDVWVIKINSHGHLVGQNCFGGNQDDVPSTIIRTGKQEYILSGWTKSTDGDIQSNQGKNDGWLLKFRN